MPCLHPIDVFIRSVGHSFAVPCNKCDECLNRRKQGYIFRIQNECLHGAFKYRYFITLTYSDSYLPYESFSQKCKGSPVKPVITGQSLLCPYDLSQFFKRYRLFSGDKVRYFACGEYGDIDKTHRPHFHIVLFTNHDWKSCKHYCELAWSYLVAESVVERAKRYKLQTKLNTTIKRDGRNMANRVLIGRINIRSVTYRRICYVAKYCNKVLYSQEAVPPFIRLSNGLGDSFLESDTAKLCKSQNRHFSFFENGLPVAIPRYYSHKIFSVEQMNDFNLNVINSLNPPEFTEVVVEPALSEHEEVDDYFIVHEVPDWNKLVAWHKARSQEVDITVKRSRLARYGLLL